MAWKGCTGGQAPGSQVPPDLVFQAQEQAGPVRPVADALQAVHQVGEGLREVGPQRKCLPSQGLVRILLLSFLCLSYLTAWTGSVHEGLGCVQLCVLQTRVRCHALLRGWAIL